MKTLSIMLSIFLLLVISKLVFAKKQPLPPLHHPVGIKLPASMDLPEKFPLGKQKELVCDTCHGINNIEKIPLQKVNTQASNFLRNGPYPSLLDFCSNCHQSTLKQKNMQRFNIHQMLDKQGKIIEKNCTYCHASVPDPATVKDWHTLRFHLPPEKLCLGCHLKTTHLNTLSHQLKPSNKVLKQLQKTEKQKHIILPLDKQGRMMCVTCHTPHQHGVIEESRAGGKQVHQTSVEEGIQYGKENRWSRVFKADKKQRLATMQRLNKKIKLPEYRPIKKEILLRLAAKDGQLCQACHKFKD